MDESTKRIRNLVQEVMSEARDAVRLENVDTGQPITVGMSYRYGMVTLRFANSYTLHLSPDDAVELADAIAALAATGKREQ